MQVLSPPAVVAKPVSLAAESQARQAEMEALIQFAHGARAITLQWFLQ